MEISSSKPTNPIFADKPALAELFNIAKNQITPETEVKFVGLESIITILVYHGLKFLLPELKEWLKLGFSVVVIKRLEIEKKLKEYAVEKELDYKTASDASGIIVKNINEDNIGKIISELGKE
jgi:hypothetical protein